MPTIDPDLASRVARRLSGCTIVILALLLAAAQPVPAARRMYLPLVAQRSS